MLIYDKDNRTLHLRKMDIDSIPDGKDLLEDQKRSYQTYKNQTIYSDIEYLEKVLVDTLGHEELQVSATVGELYRSRPSREMTGRGASYYPISLEINSEWGTRHVPHFMKLPYMDDFCTLNVDGKKKVLVSEMQSNEDVSFDAVNEQVIVVLPSRLIKAARHQDKLGFVLGKKILSADLVLPVFAEHEGVEFSESIFANSLLLRSFNDKTYKIQETIDAEINKNNIVDYYKSKRCRLGKTRLALNKKLTIDSAIGFKLSRPIFLKRDSLKGSYAFDDLILKPGKVITEKDVKRMKYNYINEVYVKQKPIVQGLSLAFDLDIKVLEAGTRVSKTLAKLVPELTRNTFITQDLEVNLVFTSGTVIDDDLADVLYHSNIVSFQCVTKKIKIPKTYFCEQEIIGNKTSKAKDILSYDEIDELNISADDHIYWGTTDPLAEGWIPSTDLPDRLTTHDLVGIISLLGREVSYPDMGILGDRDADFLKKINMSNRTFSNAMRKAVDGFVLSYRTAINEWIKTGSISSNGIDNAFIAFHSWWMKELNNTTLLSEADDVNPASLISQINKVTTRTQGAHSAPDALRMIGMGYYGRICPYETPAGAKVGLTTNLAVGCRVEDGIPLTYYKKVTKTNKGYKLNQNPITLTAEDEAKYRVGDILTLKFDDNGYIINTRVLAKVPALSKGIESVNMITVDSHNLQYVYAYPEQHLSIASMFMPFADSNDGARVSFGINLIKQAIYIQNSEAPRVTTPIYRKVFDYSEAYLRRAKKAGTVLRLQHNVMYVQYDDDIDETAIEVIETNISRHCALFMNFKKGPGARFKEGDILVDSAVSRDGYMSPGANLLTAYISYEGYNYEDAIALARSVSHYYTSIGGHEVSKTVKTKIGDKLYTPRIEFGNKYRYIGKDEEITKLTLTQLDNRQNHQNETFKTDKAGILYDIESEEEDNKRTYTAKILSFNRLKEGDKLAGRHGNKGVQALVEENSKMPTFMNGEIVQCVLNSTGVGSRMNVGQLKDGHLGFFGHLFDIRVESESFNGATLPEIKLLMKYLHALANRDYDSVVAEYTMIPRELHERAYQRLDHIHHWKGCFDDQGRAELYDPKTGTMFEYPITFGMPYILKMVQEVEEKLHARGGPIEGRYLRLSGQPTQGARNHGGQKMGEMELASVAAHGCQAYLSEITNEKSDNIERRTNLVLESLGMPPVFDGENYQSRSVETLRYLIETFNLKLKGDELPPLDFNDVKGRKTYDPRMLLRKRSKGVTEVETSSSIMEDLDDI